MELVVALALVALVATAAARMLAGHQRAYRNQSERLAMAQNVRAALAVLRFELRELGTDPTAGDIIDMTPHSISYEAARGVLHLCTPPELAARKVTLAARGTALGFGSPDPGVHGVLLFAENDSAGFPAGRWLRASIADVRGGRGCPRGEPSVLLVLGGLGGSELGRVLDGAPVRLRVRTKLSVYTDAWGDQWIGLQTQSAPGNWSRRQPLVGPVTARGLRFQYFDRLGIPATSPASVARVGVTVSGRSSVPIRGLSGILAFSTFTLHEQIAPRNARP